MFTPVRNLILSISAYLNKIKLPFNKQYQLNVYLMYFTIAEEFLKNRFITKLRNGNLM